MTKKHLPCMIDHRGYPVETWLVEMQSAAFLRQSISAGHRTAECWAELTRQNIRRRAVEALIVGWAAVG
jgi:hypothetical protein